LCDRAFRTSFNSTHIKIEKLSSGRAVGEGRCSKLNVDRRCIVMPAFERREEKHEQKKKKGCTQKKQKINKKTKKKTTQKHKKKQNKPSKPHT